MLGEKETVAHDFLVIVGPAVLPTVDGTAAPAWEGRSRWPSLQGYESHPSNG